MAADQFVGASKRTVGNHDATRAGLQQRGQHTGRRTSCPQQADASALDAAAGQAQQVIDQALAVGVVREDVAFEQQGIGCLRALGPVAAAGGQGPGFAFKGDRYVAAAAAAGGQFADQVGK